MKTQAIPVICAPEGPARRPDPERGSFTGVAAIFVLSLAIYLPLLGSAPLAGTEGHRVFPALNMIQSGDWLLPRLFGQLYLIKPPLHDWIIAIAQVLSGSRGNEFVWRFPSAIDGALLNVALYLFGARWFGRIGGIVSGLSGLGLLCLWGQARTADVDATNTLACSLAALCLIELYFGRPTRRGAWICGAGAALGATLLTKGPAGLPLIVAIMIYAMRWRVAPQEPRIRDLLSPLLIGVALFGLYAVAAKIALNRLHLPPDYSGVAEVGNKFYPSSLSQFGLALLVPAELFVYTLPVSIALVLAFVPEFVSAIAASEQKGQMPRARLTRAMAVCTLISWGICIASGMVNPRYAYVTVAPLCLLAGAVAASVPCQIREAQSVFRVIVLASVVLIFNACAALTFLAWRGRAGHVVMIAGSTVALAVGTFTFIRLARFRDFEPAWGLFVLVVIAAVPFAFQFRLDRFDRSGYGHSQALRDYVGGPDAPVLAGAVLHSLPELFWYAGLHPRTTPTFALQNPRQYSGGTWVVMDPEELRRWTIFTPRRLSRIKTFMIHKDQVTVAWFAADEPFAAATQPATRPLPPPRAMSRDHSSGGGR